MREQRTKERNIPPRVNYTGRKKIRGTVILNKYKPTRSVVCALWACSNICIAGHQHPNDAITKQMAGPLLNVP